jgi:hypothetical protein
MSTTAGLKGGQSDPKKRNSNKTNDECRIKEFLNFIRLKKQSEATSAIRQSSIVIPRQTLNAQLKFISVELQVLHLN